MIKEAICPMRCCSAGIVRRARGRQEGIVARVVIGCKCISARIALFLAKRAIMFAVYVVFHILACVLWVPQINSIHINVTCCSHSTTRIYYEVPCLSSLATTARASKFRWGGGWWWEPGRREMGRTAEFRGCPRIANRKLLFLYWLHGHTH